MHEMIHTPLAIVGMACRLPGAENLDEFWQLIRAGRCALGEVSEDRLNRELFYDPRKGTLAKSYTTLAGLVTPRQIDPRQWALSEEEISTAHPMQLELCDATASALRHAEMDPAQIAGLRAGVYLGHTGGSAASGRMAYATQVEHTVDYLREVPGFEELLGEQSTQVLQEIVEQTRGEYSSQGFCQKQSASAFLAARLVSNAFGLDGPYFSIDAACASSLMATMMGVQALQLGDIDMAIVGGGSRCEYDTLITMSKAQSVSATGSRPFDATADGLVVAEGYVVLVLKRLEDAIAQKNPIWSVIQGIGVSSDGRGKSLWAPRSEGQVEAVKRAYRSPDEMRHLQFVEAHATSTQVGDATEVQALAEALQEFLPAGKRCLWGV